MRTKHFLFALLTALCLVTAWAQPFDADIRQTADYKQAQTWVPVLLRDNAAGYRTNLFAPNTPLMFTTNGQVVANTGTNVLKFTNEINVGTLRIFENGLNHPSGSLDFDQGLLYCSGGWDLGSSGLLFVGPISFDNSINAAATTRTNLGLGGGITTNRTFVSYNGTNYTTNSVTISNGIITGWTQ